MATAQPIRLLIVDDHAMVREGLARILEKEPGFEMVGQCASSEEAAPFFREGVTMTLLDVDLGSSRALEFITNARACGFEGQILIVTAGISGTEAVQLIQAGAAGIVHKHQSTETLGDVIRQVAGGSSYLESDYLSSLFKSVDRTRATGKPKLTERDRTVLRGIFQGLTNREIAARVQVSEGAIKASIRQLFDKLGVRTRAQAVKIAIEQHREYL